MALLTRYKSLAIFIGVVLVMVAIYLVVKGPGDPEIQFGRVELTTVRQVVEETGVVKAAQEADLSFEQTGTVALTPVTKGSRVTAGQILVALDSSTQAANLAGARAELAIEESNLTQQGTLIENAYRKLLSSELAPYTLDTDVTAAAPTISGRYTGPEGQYKMIIEQTSATSDAYELRLFGLEKLAPVVINKTNPTPLGSYGLLVTFPDALTGYDNTIWYVDIPNKDGASYTTNLNAYVAAKETGAAAEDLQAQKARIDRARAAVTSAEIELARTVLRAPFAGVVTDIQVERGETVAPRTPVVSLISQSQYEISVDIPEADIAEVTVGDAAEITFDAYDDAVFRAHVVFVTPSASVENDVATFEVTLQFDQMDERIRAGLSADVEILAVERAGVLALPNRAIIEPSRGERFVRALRDGALVEIPVATGVRGSDGVTEVTSGLHEGEEVIVFISDEELEALERAR